MRSLRVPVVAAVSLLASLFPEATLPADGPASLSQGTIVVSRLLGNVWARGTVALDKIQPLEETTSPLIEAFRKAVPATAAERVLEPEFLAMFTELVKNSGEEEIIRELLAGRLLASAEGLKPWVLSDDGRLRLIARYSCVVPLHVGAEDATMQQPRLEQRYELLHATIECRALLRRADWGAPLFDREVRASRYILLAREELSPRIAFHSLAVAFAASDDEAAHAYALRTIRALIASISAHSAAVKLLPPSALRKEESEAVGSEFTLTFTAKGRSVMLHLESLFDNDGISTAANRTDGNFDLPGRKVGDTYPAEALPAPGIIAPFADEPELFFIFPSSADGHKNNLTCEGQRLLVPRGRYEALCLLGAAETGDQSGEMLLHYAAEPKTRRASFDLALSDWCDRPKFGERIAYAASFRHSLSGGVERDVKPSLWMQRVPLENHSELLSVTLPKNARLHIFALTLLQARNEKE